MTPPRKPLRNKRGDLRFALLALGLLLVSGSLWLWMSSDARTRRDSAVASVPDFPSRGQPVQHPRRAPAEAPRRPVLVHHAADAGRPAPRKLDGMTSFVLHPAHSVGVVNVNALVNTPLFARIKECLPVGFEALNARAASLGVDFERDVDRVAFFEGGAAVSGFFEGKPVAQALIARAGQAAETRDYRDATIYSVRNFAVAQIGNVVVEGSPDTIRGLIDRVLDPPPAGADAQDIYGDVFLRSDLEAFRGTGGAGQAAGPMDAMLDSLSGMTVRANVWDSVALSLEGAPAGGKSVAELSRMARGALQLARDQVDQEDVELSALADLARVTSADDGLHVDLAVPAKDLFDKLHFPCPGKEGTPAPDAGPQLVR